jgi:Uma2 family endonuclease
VSPELQIRYVSPELQEVITAPILIVEVLSPSTAAADRDRKLPDYRTIPSLQDILVVSSTEPRIEHFRREPDGWKIHDLRGDGSLRLQGFDCSLDLDDLYNDLTLGPTPPRRPL